MACTSERVKCVWVGDHVAQKKCMLSSYKSGSYPAEPTSRMVFENYAESVVIDGRHFVLSLWDDDSNCPYNYLRTLVAHSTYSDTDVFVVCYSITSPLSLEHVKSKWLPEIRSYCPDAPFVLVGTTSIFTDLRKKSRALGEFKARGGHLVDPARVKEIAEELGAARVMECSGRNQSSLKLLVDQSLRLALAARTYGSNFKSIKHFSDAYREGEKQTTRLWCRIFAAAPKRFHTKANKRRKAEQSQKLLVKFFATYPGLQRLVGRKMARYYSCLTADTFNSYSPSPKHKNNCVVM